MQIVVQTLILLNRLELRGFDFNISFVVVSCRCLRILLARKCKVLSHLIQFDTFEPLSCSQTIPIMIECGQICAKSSLFSNTRNMQDLNYSISCPRRSGCGVKMQSAHFGSKALITGTKQGFSFLAGQGYISSQPTNYNHVSEYGNLSAQHGFVVNYDHTVSHLFAVKLYKVS